MRTRTHAHFLAQCDGRWSRQCFLLTEGVAMQIGERIAAYRKRRGMSQDALAGLVGMSRSWLSQVERGIYTVDRLSTLADLATVLRVDVADLVGHEWRLAPNGAPHVRAMEAIRKQLAGYGHLLGDQPRPWPLPQ